MSTTKILIVGLGNPEANYRYTRHNAGAEFVQYFAATNDFPDFKPEKKFHALLSHRQLQDKEVILALPQTYMNLSGKSVAALVQFYRLHPSSDLLVAHDDLDITFGQSKLTTHAPRTHNGLANISQALATTNFSLLRLGVDSRAGSRLIPSRDFVLLHFTPEEQTQLRQTVFPAAAKEVLSWL